MLIEQNERMMAENTKLREELNSTHFRLREANNQIAYLEFELESLKQDAGAEIHDLMTRHSAKLAAAEVLAVASKNLLSALEADDMDWMGVEHEYGDLIAALRQYREAGNG